MGYDWCIYIGAIIIGWVEYIRGYIILLGILLATFIFPLLIFGAYNIRKSERTNLVYRVIWVISGAASIGGLIWFPIAYIYYGAPWAPFRDYPLIFRIPFDIITTVLCWALGGYIGYRLGKKRDFRPFM